MMTLAVDTTGDYGSIALADESGVREEVLLHEPRGFSHVLFAEIEALLARQRITLQEVDLFAGASGPGSFTGLRVGLAAMKGLAEVLGRGMVAVSNLETLAAFGTAPLRAVIIDARRGEVFAALYDAEGRAVIAPSVIAFEKFLARMPEAPFEWISADFDVLTSMLAGTRFESLPCVEAPRALAGMIARMAMTRPALDPAAIEADYVRRSDAELFWKEV
jgi:tRNA threonylcarbamoyladenosine biosynthesis protein TsaB